MFILHTLPVYADDSGGWCTETKFLKCLNEPPANSKRDSFVQEINNFLTIQNYINCGITAKNLSDYTFWGRQNTAINPGCILSQNMADWMQENCNCDSSFSAYPTTESSSTDSDYILFNNALGREIFSQLKKGNISLNGTPVPTPLPSIPTPTSQSTPTPNPTPNPDLELTDLQLQMAKCGLRAANYQCCYPNAEITGTLPKGSFFDAIAGLWNTISSVIQRNITNLNFFQSDLTTAVTDGSNYPPDLCPRTDEGKREERFYDTNDSSRWIDQNDKYQDIIKYEDFLYGIKGDERDYTQDGLVGAIYSSEEIPLINENEGVEYQGKSYNCVCVNPATEISNPPDYYINLSTNTTASESPSSFPDLIAGKLCRNISDEREQSECMACVHGGKTTKENDKWVWIQPEVTNTDLGGAWTAIGCIKADFSSTLQNTLFPLFIGLGGLISLGCIIYASFLLQTSMGEPEKITKAQELMTSCITGLIVILFSIFILRVIGVDILRLPGLNQEAVSGTPTPTTSTITGTPTPDTTAPTTPTSSTAVPTTPLANYDCRKSPPERYEVYLYDFNNGGIQGPCLRLTRDDTIYNLLDEKYKNNSMYKGNANISKVNRCADNWNDCINKIVLGADVTANVYLHLNNNDDSDIMSINQSEVLTGDFLDSITKIKIIQK